MISSGDGCPRSGRSPTAATGHCLLARNARPTAGFAAYNQIRNYRRVVGSGRCEYGDGQLRDGSSATATAYQCDYAHLRCRINSGCSGDQQRVRRWRRADGLSWGEGEKGNFELSRSHIYYFWATGGKEMVIIIIA